MCWNLTNTERAQRESCGLDGGRRTAGFRGPESGRWNLDFRHEVLIADNDRTDRQINVVHGDLSLDQVVADWAVRVIAVAMGRRDNLRRYFFRRLRNRTSPDILPEDPTMVES